ncbi:MAG: heavy-metal-associated domain-containing protein, partial [Prevotella pallens]|nr:heavy-metal-associated domain-containing protein [Prevotella pallens]
MKKSLIIMMLAMVAITASAKDIKTVIFTTTPQMHCEN